MQHCDCYNKVSYLEPLLAFWAHSSWNIFNRCNFATAPSKFRFEPPLEFCVHSSWKTRNRCDPWSCNFSSTAVMSLWLLHVSAEFSLPLSFRAGPVVVNNAFVRRRLYYTQLELRHHQAIKLSKHSSKLWWKQSCVHSYALDTFGSALLSIPGSTKQSGPTSSRAHKFGHLTWPLIYVCVCVYE